MEEIKKLPQRSEVKKEDTWATEDMYVSDEAWEAEAATLAADQEELVSYAGDMADSAEKLLTSLWTNAYSINEIAQMCGYDDALYFSRVFKKRFGCSPTKYIRKDAEIHGIDPGRKEKDTL